MATYVLVPGGWAGGWYWKGNDATYLLVPGAWTGDREWKKVTRYLLAGGHEAIVATIAGPTDRKHLLKRQVDLDTHIRKVVDLLQYENLSRVVLVGYGYSGMVVSGAAELVPERLAHVVYLDAFVPQDGESLAGILGPEAMASIEDAANQFSEAAHWHGAPPDWPWVPISH